MKLKEYLNESSLSRLWKHMQDHDSGMITAYRSTLNKKENQQRNNKLLAMIQDKRYNVTSVKGSYIENQGRNDEIEVGEHVFFVVDVNDTGNLEQDLKKMGEFGKEENLEQDSIMFIPKGSNKGIIWGTSKRKDLRLSYNKKEILPNAVWGKKGTFMTKVRNRPFFFKEEVIRKHILPKGFFGRYACHSVAVTDWRDN